MKRPAFSLLPVLLLLAGCTLFDPLPPGPPPSGPIVKNAPKDILDADAAANYYTTALSIYLLTNPIDPNAVCLDADEATKNCAKTVLDELSRITGTRLVSPPCPYTLKTRAEHADAWSFSLISPKGILWYDALFFHKKNGAVPEEGR